VIIPSSKTNGPRPKAVWGPKRTVIALALIALATPLNADAGPKSTHRQSDHQHTQVGSRHFDQAPTAKDGLPSSRVDNDKLDGELKNLSRGVNPGQTVDCIVVFNGNSGNNGNSNDRDVARSLPREFRKYLRRNLPVINGVDLKGVPAALLGKLQSETSVHRVSRNRSGKSLDLLSSTAMQADVLAKQFGYTGAGVGVAVIDSGFTSYPQPDLKDSRIVKFVDFVNGAGAAGDYNNNYTVRSDLNGHGTHVTGIVGGTGKLDPNEAGIAPGASIISLRVLDEQGRGSVGDIIAAMDWISTNYIKYNIRVVNMSVGAGVYESYWTDPLTLAAKALVDKGITVVAAAGNYGKNKAGNLQWGGITSPGVAPWVLTVCAFSTKGTLDPSDDEVANFSSSGPTFIDFTAKPDVCAPGVGIVSLAAPESLLFSTGALQTPSWLIDPGNHPSYPYAPYLSLTGTSQATPFVTGTVALMLQANPNLTPNLIKGILQYTASFKPNVSPLRQGAGFANTLGAVQLARFYATAKPGADVPIDPSWSQHIIWGNHMLTGGVLSPNGNAWMPGVEWGWAYTQGTDGDNIVWGTSNDGDNIVWGTADDADNIVWGFSADGDNIVWGTDCGGADCDHVIWGAHDALDNIVWGTAADGDNIVWGTAADLDNIVWGTFDELANIVWGTLDDLDNIVWGTSGNENVVWPIYRKGAN
jgi:serine protease AprX